MTPFHLSAKHGKANMIEVVAKSEEAIKHFHKKTLQDVWKNVSSKNGFNALHIATKGGNVSILLLIY